MEVGNIRGFTVLLNYYSVARNCREIFKSAVEDLRLVAGLNPGRFRSVVWFSKITVYPKMLPTRSDAD